MNQREISGKTKRLEVTRFGKKIDFLTKKGCTVNWKSHSFIKLWILTNGNGKVLTRKYLQIPFKYLAIFLKFKDGAKFFRVI